MMKNKKQHFFKKKLQIPVYTGKLGFVFTNKLSKYPDFEDDLYACSLYKGERRHITFYIYINFWGLNIIDHGTIAHEVSHTTDNIMNYHHIIKSEIDESSAYLTGWITNEIYKFIKECNLKVHYIKK